MKGILSDLTKLDIKKTKSLLKSGEITALALTESFLNAAKSANNRNNAFISFTEDLAISQAVEADKRLRQGRELPLDGIPIGVKDLFCIKGIRTTAGSAMLKNYVPTYSATIINKLFSAGGICLGKTNMDEFAMGSANTYSYFGPVINPKRRRGEEHVDLVPGGSSGGSAAVVADNICLAALGSDTGGSVRQPASFCGVVGVKPTYGRCSRYGMIPLAGSLDQPGVMTKTVYDSALVLAPICGGDAKDSTSANIDVPNFSEYTEKSIKGMRVGIPVGYVEKSHLNEDIAALWKETQMWLRDSGAKIVDISIPHAKAGIFVYYILVCSEASSYLARYDGIRYGMRIDDGMVGDMALQDKIIAVRDQCFGNEVKKRIIAGNCFLSDGCYEEFFSKAQKIRHLIFRDFAKVFASEVDVILVPTAPSVAFALNEKVQDPTTMYLNDIFTVPVSLAGLPAISVPCGFDKKYGLPLGMQVIAGSYKEADMFRIAGALERAANIVSTECDFWTYSCGYDASYATLKVFFLILAIMSC